MEATATYDRQTHDYQLVCDARDRGNYKAYADLMSAYREPLYLLLLRMTHNTTTASDLTVDTFSKAFCQLHRYAPTGTFSSWLFSIGVNTYIDYIRKRRLDTVSLSNMQRSQDNDFVEYQIPSGSPNPEERLIRQQRDEALRKLSDDLGLGAMRRFSDAVSQALAFGSPLAAVLEQQAQAIRAEQRAEMEEQIEKVPVKMLIPLGTLIVPAMLIAILGPLLGSALTLG